MVKRTNHIVTSEVNGGMYTGTKALGLTLDLFYLNKSQPNEALLLSLAGITSSLVFEVNDRKVKTCSFNWE